jgi:hypothetical protein
MDYFHQWHWFVFAFNRSIKLSQACKKLIMPTTIAHSAIAVGLGPCFIRAGVKPRFWVLGALCAALPDIDTIGFHLGVPYTWGTVALPIPSLSPLSWQAWQQKS